MDRFFTIRFPLKYGRNKTRKYMILKIVLVWLISILICFPMFTLGVYNEKNVFNAALRECTLEHREFKIYGSIFAFYIPLIIIAVTYIFTMKSLNNLMKAKIKYDYLNGSTTNSATALASSTPVISVTTNPNKKIRKSRSIFSILKSSNNTSVKPKCTYHERDTRNLSFNYSRNESISVVAIENFRKRNDSMRTIATRIDDYHEIEANKIQKRISEKSVVSFLLHPKSISYQRRACSFNESYLMRRNNINNFVGNSNASNNNNKNNNTEIDKNIITNSNSLIIQKYVPQRKLPLITRHSFLIKRQDRPNSKDAGLEKIFQKYFSETNLILKFNKKSFVNNANNRSVKSRIKRFKPNSYKSKSDFHLYFKKFNKSNANHSTSLSNISAIKYSFKKHKPTLFNINNYECGFCLKLKKSPFKRSTKDKIQECKKLQKILASIEREMDAFLVTANKDDSNCKLLTKNPRKSSLMHKIPNSIKTVMSTTTTTVTTTTTTTTTACKNIDPFKRFSNHSRSINKNEKNKLTKFLTSLTKSEDKKIYKSNPILTKPQTKYGFLFPRDSKCFDESILSNKDYKTQVPALSYDNSINTINLIVSNNLSATDIKNSLLNSKKSNPSPSSSTVRNTNGRSIKVNVQESNAQNSKQKYETQLCPRNLGGNNNPRKSIISNNKETNSYNQNQMSGFSKANNERKAVKVLIIIFVIFVASWTPFFVVNTLSVFCYDICKPIYSFMGLFTWLGYISSSINPIIYTVFNKSFRQTFIALLRCRNEFFNSRLHQRLLYERRFSNRKTDLVK